MPPRLSCRTPRALRAALTRQTTKNTSAASIWPASTVPSPSVAVSRSYASAVSIAGLKLPDDYVPPTQPPSARPPDVRKSQLLRTYTSLLRSTPLALIFQHNNLTALEWAALRRELNLALSNVPAAPSDPADLAKSIQLQVIRTRIFDVAMKVVEFHDPSVVPESESTAADGSKVRRAYNHDLSRAAYNAVEKAVNKAEALPTDSIYAQLSPLMVGPLALLTFPAVSPAHLAAALSILSPSPPAFPAPSKKKSPGYYDPMAQSALQKLILVGGRIEGKVFDTDGVRWVGGINGGLDALRAQLVAMLQSTGLGLTNALEGASRSLWLTVEGRKMMLEEEGKAPEGEAGAKTES